MYAIYAYSNTATLANVIADIAAILTGETTKANLSAGCNQTDTSISAAYDVAGWAMYDPASNNATSVTFDSTGDTVTLNGHGLENGERVSFTTVAGTMPPEVNTANTTVYYVVNKATNTFQISLTLGGAPVDFSTNGSGTITLWTGRKQIFRAACLNAASEYKYVQLDYASSGYINMTMLEGWTVAATGKTPVYQTSAFGTTGAAAGAQRTAIGVSGGLVRVFASVRRMILQSSTTAGGVGADTNNGWLGVFERARLAPWDVVGAGPLPAVLSCGFILTAYVSASWSYCTRYKTLAADVTGASAVVRTVMRGFISNIYVNSALRAMGMCPTFKVPDGAGGLYCPFSDIGFSHVGNAFPGGSISEVSDVWMPPQYANLDRTTYNGKQYLFLQNTNTPNLDGCIAVPMG